jgi:hypothetical protein
MCLGHSHDRFNVPDRDVDTSRPGRLLSQFQIELLDDIQVFVWKLWSAFLPCVFDVLFQEFVVNVWPGVLLFRQHFLCHVNLVFLDQRMALGVGVNDECRQVMVDLLLDLILDDTQDVKS